MIQEPLILRKRRGMQGSKIRSFPAPIGGLNLRDPIASMPATDAIEMVNWWPSTSDVIVRKGADDWATSIPAPVKTLLPYSHPNASGKLFAATDGGIYDASVTGAVGAAVQTIASGEVSHTMFTVPGGTYLVTVNGVDTLRLFNGTAWSAITSSSTPISITGVPTTDLSYVHAFKQRLWFVEKDSLSLWYLPAGQVGGAAAEFPLGQLFSRGGYLVAVGSWTVDAGSGADDFLIALTSEGEIAVYSGTDPATNFSLTGIFYVGKPIGKFPITKFGGDNLLLTQTGIFPLTRALTSSTVSDNTAVSNKIDFKFSEYASQFSGNYGWQGAVFSKENLFLTNIPVLSGNKSVQLVMNTITGAWTQFEGWDAFCFAEFQGSFYFGGSTFVAKCMVGENDFGGAVKCKLRSAFNYLGSRSLKHVKMIRPLINVSQSLQLDMGIDVDYEDSGLTFQIQTGEEVAQSLWDTAVWDSSTWASALPYQRYWRSVDTKEGFAVSLRIEAEVLNSSLSWSATDYLFESGGVL